MRVAMIGAGYVGLVSGACFADFGHHVVCVDSDKRKVEELNKGNIPIYEPGLSELVRQNLKEGRLAFTNDLASGLASAQAAFIAVGTPARRGDGYADLAFVYTAARDIARYADELAVIVTKSTVPVGTGDEIERIIRELNPMSQAAVVSNPEFLREGAAIHDFKHPDRIVIGTDDLHARDVLAELYRPLYLNAAPLLYTSRRAAELIKYASNAFLAMKISFINEIADLCEVVHADVQDVARGMGLDNRIGSKFLHPGPGYGGSCFPKDTLALIKIGQDNAAPLRLVETCVAINDQRKRNMTRKIVAALGGTARGKCIAVLGLTFKPNTDDMRDSPAITIVTMLQDMGARVQAYDPAGMQQARKVLDNVQYFEDPYSCATDADALVIVTEWEQFRALDLGRLKKLMGAPVLLDLRNIYRPEEIKDAGFVYDSIGRPGGNAGGY